MLEMHSPSTSEELTDIVVEHRCEKYDQRSNENPALAKGVRQSEDPSA
jgi:hypothetical protein